MGTIRTILVHVDSSERCGARLRYAHALGERHEAQVIALYAVASADLQYPYAPGAGYASSAMQQEYELGRKQRARATYDAVRAGGLSRLQWEELPRDQPPAALATRALYADLLVLGQREPPAETVPDVPSDFVESVVVDSGKPAIVVPYIGPPATVARTVLVAWKATREAGRALAAAMPMLCAAENVHIALWSDSEGAADDAAGPIEAYLRSHGVTAKVHRYGEASRDVGNHLLSAAADASADLIVMGSYGHSRAREWVLGGATRTVLQSMTVPVLMVH